MIRVDRVQAGVVAILRELVPGATVLWAPTEYPRGMSGDLVVARIITGPSIASPSVYYEAVPTDVTLTFNSVEDGQLYGLNATGAAWRLEADDDDTVGSVRDAFLTMLDEEQPGLAATISPVGAASLRIVGVGLGALWGFGTSGDVTLVVNAETDAVVQTSHATFRIEVQVFGASGSRYPRGGAAQMMGEILGGLYHPAIRSILDDYGVSIWGGPSDPTDLTAISGANYESRSAVQFTVATRSYQARAINTIEDLTLTLSTDHGSSVVTATIPE